MGNSEHIRNIALDVVLSVVTCGLYYLYWHYKQLEAVNAVIGEDRFSFVKWLLLTLLTCGLWHIYHEYMLSQAVSVALGRNDDSDALVALVLSVFQLSIVADAIRQSQLNGFFRA